jgi:hypothetical protein
VLQRGKGREQHEQDDGSRQLPVNAAHESTLRETTASDGALYISYKTIAGR